MPFISSPVEYPPTSSPKRSDSPRKRRKIDAGGPREPLNAISPNLSTKIQHASLAGFADDDDSDNDVPTNIMSSNVQNEKPTSSPPATHSPSWDDFIDFNAETQQAASTPATSPPPEAMTVTGIFKQAEPAKSVKTSSGNVIEIKQRARTTNVFYGDIIAAKSRAETQRAQKDYYGINIHKLMDEGNAAIEATKTVPEPLEHTVEAAHDTTTISSNKPPKLHLWTEKYRARKFTDLLGDERTHRSVLRWFKGWDSVVFPHAAKPKVKSGKFANDAASEDRLHKKILLLTGPPGLGKTTMAHICARQAGYETKEINASDERSKDVVDGRIRDMVGTENVRSVDAKDSRKAAKPLCIVVDEVDGVVGGSSGGGEGGFIKALIDLVSLDQRNSGRPTDQNAPSRKKRKGENFRLLRPLVLICNDVYHPSLRPLRQSPVAEVIHVRRPPLNMVIPRLSSIFAREGIPSDNDGVRTLCEAAWGVTSKKKGGAGTRGGGGTTEGDIRSILVIGEWVASKLRCASLDSASPTQRLSRQWVEKHVVGELAHGGGAARSLGRGGGKECVQRVFAHNAGFALSASTKETDVTEDLLGEGGAIEAAKKANMDRLREMVQASGEEEKIMTDCFTTWPSAPYQDTTTLTKPCAAHDWLHFSSLISHRVHTGQEWDLMAYMPYPALAFHSLFAAMSAHPVSATTSAHNNDQSGDANQNPFTGPRPDATAAELHKTNLATLTELHSTLTLPLRRIFPNPQSLSADLLPYTLRLLNPSANPTLLGGQASLRRAPEKERVARAASAMSALGVRFDKARVEGPDTSIATASAGANNAGWVLRMRPPLDSAGTFATLDDARAARPAGDAGRARYALRLVLEQAFASESARRDAEARMRRRAGPDGGVIVDKAYGTSAGGTDGDDGGAPSAAASDSADATRARAKGVKRDFFGRPIVAVTAAGDAVAAGAGDTIAAQSGGGAARGREAVRGRSAVWVTFHEGFSNAVRKPITMGELLDGLT